MQLARTNAETPAKLAALVQDTPEVLDPSLFMGDSDGLFLDFFSQILNHQLGMDQYLLIPFLVG